jgi:hypothetical protein
VLGNGVAAAALALWLVVGAKAAGTIRSRSVTARWLLASLAFLALGITVFVPRVQEELAIVVPVGQLNQAVARTSIVGAVFCAQTLVRLMAEPRTSWRDGRQLAPMAATTALMWVMFLLRPNSVPFGSHPVGNVRLTLFMLAFLGYVSYAVNSVMSGCWRYSQRTAGAMRVGLRMIAVGCAGGLGYSAVKASAMLAFAVQSPLDPRWESVAAQSLAVLASLLLAAGTVAVSARERLSDLHAWWDGCWALRYLYVLWADLVAAVPNVALDPPVGRRRDALRWGDVHLRLYRRLIELRDAWLALRPFMDADVLGPLGPDSTGIEPVADAEVEAVMLWTAIRARQDGRLPLRQWISDVASVSSVDDELAWWSAVAAAWPRVVAMTACDRAPERTTS